MLDAYKRNWITSRDGNCSIRYHDREHFYITPSGTRKQTLQPDQFKKIGVETGYYDQPPRLYYSSSVLPYTAISQNLHPSGELPLHFGLQKQIVGEVRVVVHVHPTYSIAAMHAGIDLSTISDSFPELNRYTRVAPNVAEVPPISQELADQCFQKLGLDSKGNVEYDIVGIVGHGVVALGNSPWRAYEHVERLEHICKIVLASGRY
jgi:L-fuculose-phosphate aldolase